jgi:hypothetical protein
MKIVTIGNNLYTPKNYSRKGKICSCLCPITYLDTKKVVNIEKVLVKYEVEPNKESTSYISKLKKNQWSSYQYWGKFKQITELPKIFEKLNEEDFKVKIGSFSRDNIQMPYVSEIEILNVDK